MPNWLNDPQRAVYDRESGLGCLYFLYNSQFSPNPVASKNDTEWFLMTSSDLVTWTAHHVQKTALWYSTDRRRCYSFHSVVMQNPYAAQRNRKAVWH
ncbi:glycoside hydrolase family protein [Gluconobacter japonicus]|uniref:Glycosyl hydrolase family 32 N-terminal domain-containing protein n=1 Tax=Gluconobacter japonicus TaxID=376620 RepID=A0ABQ5WFM7_GLUJA|nr:hypothetical protein [Gluconobacter japonicus]KXV25338.1 hypothetical protein AD938_12055 [Gluconobacter japonicus]GBR23800.1 hypothetical protein AA3271_1619 [Gluconobacter japonicus NBRC 3271]GLQ58963.1 hypothetical protein GCM10010937_07660 [Gluconobacter japonicus]